MGVHSITATFTWLVIFISISGVRTEKVIGELHQFCHHDQEELHFPFHLYLPAIDFIIEDQYKDGCMLMTVKGYIKVKEYGLLERSLLFRTCSNGSAQWLTGPTNNSAYLAPQFLEISSVLQLNQSHMLIGDNGTKCIHVLDEISGIVSTFSGKCSTEPGSKQDTSMDGGFSSAEYVSIGQLYRSPTEPHNVLVLDRNNVRKLNLNDRFVKTVFTHKNRDPLRGIIWKNDIVLLSSIDTIEAYYSNWTFKEHIIQNIIPTLKGKHYTGFHSLHMNSLTDDLIFLSFKNTMGRRSLTNPENEYNIAVIYSISKKTSVIVLYSEPVDSIATPYPSSSRITTNSSSINIYFSSAARIDILTYCSSLSLLQIKAYCIDEHSLTRHSVGTTLNCGRAMQSRCSLNYATATTYWYPDTCQSLVNRTTSSSTTEEFVTSKQSIDRHSIALSKSTAVNFQTTQRSSNATLSTSMTTAIGSTTKIGNYSWTPQNVSGAVTNVTESYHGAGMILSNDRQGANSSNFSASSSPKPPGSAITLIYVLTSVGALLLIVAILIGAYCILQKHSLRKTRCAQKRKLPEIPVVSQTDGEYCHIIRLENGLRPVNRESNDNSDEYECVTCDDHRSCRNGTYVTGAKLANNEELTCL